jgi:hypothetical protein
MEPNVNGTFGLWRDAEEQAVTLPLRGPGPHRLILPEKGPGLWEIG